MEKFSDNLQTGSHVSKETIRRRLSVVCENSKEDRNEDTSKQPYLITYNSLQTIGFLYVLIHMAMLYSEYGAKSVAMTYEHVGPAVKLLHIMQILEIIHPVIGYSKGGPFMPFFQLIGRIFLLFIMMEPEPRMQTNPLVPYLFVVWGIIEIVRHLYYVTQLLDKEYPLLIWIRYSAWMILYPMGIFGEASVMYYNLPHFQDTMRYSITLPNRWNVSVNFVLLMKIQIVVLLGPVMYILMSHMHRMRVKKMANFYF